MPKLPERRLISLDTECTGLDLRHGAMPFFVTTCNEEDEVQYWEWDVDPLTRKPTISPCDLKEVRELIEINDGRDLVLQNSKFDAQAISKILPSIANWGWPWRRTYDTLLAGHLLASNQPHDLTSMALVYLGVNIQPLEDALEEATKAARSIAQREYPSWQLAKAGRVDMPSAKEKTWKYDAWLPRAIAKAKKYSAEHPWWTVLADYGNGDSAVTIKLWRVMEKELKERGLWRIYEARRKLPGIIYDMEARGVTVSKSRTDELTERLTRESAECHQRCVDAADGEIEDLPVNGVSNALKHVIYNKFQLQTDKTTKKGNPSMDKFVLDHWIAMLPEGKPRTFVENLRAYRKRKTGLGYLESYRKFWLPTDIRGWIPKGSGVSLKDTMVVYPSYNSTGTDTLRFSGQNPNPQQVSKQEETNLRYAFGPAPERVWYSMDAKNIELRLPAYEAGEEEMVRLFEHPNDPPYFGSYHMLVFDILHPEKFTKYGMESKDNPSVKKWYGWTKAGNFAVQYGAVEQSGTADRAYHVPGAQARIQTRFGKIKKLNEKQISLAERFGYVETMPDKTVDPLRGYPLYCQRTAWGKIQPTIPLNYHIQGTAMWWMMKAMIRCHEQLKKWRDDGVVDAYMILQVHDELVFDFPEEEFLGQHKPLVAELQRLMELGGDDIGVPTPVSCTKHEVSWSEGVSL